MCNDNHDFVLRFTAIILRDFIHKLHMKTRKITEINHKLLKKRLENLRNSSLLMTVLKAL